MDTTKKTRLGFAMCGSFCTLQSYIDDIRLIADEGYDITPIMSEDVYDTSTRFGDALDFITRVEGICGKSVLHTKTEVEPIGPKKTLDILLVAPCTGNTAAKIANGISDSSVTLAVKAHLRNGSPVVIAISSNDALAANAKNIGLLLNMKNIYFVPFRQDDPHKKPSSLSALKEMIPETLKGALERRQVQPLLRV